MLFLKVLASIDEVEPAVWDGLLGVGAPPFIRWHWIHALESSGSASAQTGWEPAHLTLWRGETLVAASPAYRKFHSMGEYIYDFQWASAAESLGIEYYPKLLVGVPLSPSTAPRFLVKAGEDRAALRETLVKAMLEFARESGCSSVHLLYVPEEDAGALEGLGLSRRATLQFHWRNPGYGSYEDFLGRFNSKRRHQLRHERAAASKQGLVLTTRRGLALTSRHANLASRFYEATCQRKGWGRVQLNRDFFQRVFATMPEVVEMVEATRGEKTVAGAFNLATSERLYGRYWGCLEEVPFLHFNVCFYQSIDDCIRMGRKVFEPGAGGEHKIARGFEPTTVHSLHRIFDPKLHRAIDRFVQEERRILEAEAASAEETTGMRPWVAPC